METTSADAQPRAQSPVTAAIIAAADGTATPAQQRLAADVKEALRSASPETIAMLAEVIGPLAVVMELPYAELNPVQAWIRDQAAAADQARATPAFGDMAVVYDMLVASSKHSGPTLRLSAGANIVALDDQNRRYLIPVIARDVLDEIRRAPDTKTANIVARRKGAVQHHWSIERPGLVPTPEDLTAKLPLERGGSYLMLYQHPLEIVTKQKWSDAMIRVTRELPFSDVLIWDKSGKNSTLWSVLGNFGHCAGEDRDFDDIYQPTIARIREALLEGQQRR